MYSPWWNFSSAQRKAYLKGLAEDSKVNEMLKLRKSYGRYPDLILNMLEQKQYLFIRVFVCAKIFLKKNLKSVFLTLKRWGIRN